METKIIDWKVPETQNWTEGHFPGTPIIPAFAIIYWSKKMILEQFPNESKNTDRLDIQSAKFIRPLLPACSTQIELTSKSHLSKEYLVNWTYQFEGEKKTYIKLKFSQAVD